MILLEANDILMLLKACGAAQMFSTVWLWGCVTPGVLSRGRGAPFSMTVGVLMTMHASCTVLVLADPLLPSGGSKTAERQRSTSA